MNLRDAETGKILWQGTEDLSVPGVEHEGMAVQCLWGWVALYLLVIRPAGMLCFEGHLEHVEKDGSESVSGKRDKLNSAKPEPWLVKE